jgi:chromosome segregation ATPase
MASTTEKDSVAEALTAEVEALKGKLDALRREAEETESASQSLQDQLREAENKLALTQGAIEDYERAIAEKQAELIEAERQKAVVRHAETAARLAETINAVLDGLEAYEAAEKALVAMAGKPETRSLPSDPNIVREPWEALKEAVRRRSDIRFEDELVEAAARSRVPSVIDSLPAHLREAARARIQARKASRS